MSLIGGHPDVGRVGRAGLAARKELDGPIPAQQGERRGVSDRHHLETLAARPLESTGSSGQAAWRELSHLRQAGTELAFKKQPAGPS